VLMPVGLADFQDVAGLFHWRHIAEFACGVWYDQQHVYDRLGHQAGDRCGADVLEQPYLVAQGGPNAGGFTFEELRPGAVVLDQDDAATRQKPRAADAGGLDLLLRLRLIVRVDAPPTAPDCPCGRSSGCA
jgi:hypothetical protein